jgi:hypothetical protein
MPAQRTTPPDLNARPNNRPPNPGDETDALISRMRTGDLSDAVEAGDEDSAAPMTIVPIAPVNMSGAADWSEAPGPGGSPAIAPNVARPIPPVIAQLLGTEAERELLAVAKCLHDRERKKLTLVFHTPIGDVKCPVNWSSAEPAYLHRVRHLLLILVRSSEAMFSPHPGSEIEISFLEYPDSPRLLVICLSPPMQLYPNVGIDLLCFLPQAATVEKQGVLHEGAPSVVSDQPSQAVDEATGEPVRHGEKSASFRLPAARFTTPGDRPPEDFDRVRES